MDEETRKIRQALEAGQDPQGPCPGLEDLCALAEGSLSEQEAEPVREHLTGCESCQEVLRIGLEIEDEVLGPVPAKSLLKARSIFNPGLATKAFRALLGLLPRAQSELKPALSFRGNVAAKASQGLAGYFQEFGGYRAEVEVEQINGEHGPAAWQVMAWVEDKASKKPARGLRVSVNSRQHELESLMLERGRAIFEPVPAGEYRVDFMKQGRKLAGILIRIKGEAQ